MTDKEASELMQARREAAFYKRLYELAREREESRRRWAPKRPSIIPEFLASAGLVIFLCVMILTLKD